MRSSNLALFVAMIAALLMAAVSWQHGINKQVSDDFAGLRRQVEDLRQSNALRLEKWEALNHEQQKDQSLELARLRAEVIRLGREATAPKAPDGTVTNPVPKVVTDLDVTAFLKRTAVEQGQLLGAFRSRMMSHRFGSADGFACHAREQSDWEEHPRQAHGPTPGKLLP